MPDYTRNGLVRSTKLSELLHCCHSARLEASGGVWLEISCADGLVECLIESRHEFGCAFCILCSDEPAEAFDLVFIGTFAAQVVDTLAA